MSEYYMGQKTKGLFVPGSSEAFKVSRSKIDLFIECPRCFYLDRRLGVARPPGFPFNLNSAVDTLLKKEFDIHRSEKTTHPLMKAYGIDAIPFQHADIEGWRHNFTGIRFLHTQTKFLVFGAVDDIWVNPKGELHVVDYKSTSKDTEVNLDAEWQDGYKRQVEVYQWLFKQNGFSVSPYAYFVYANGKRDRKAFDGKLEFDVIVIPYKGDSDWVPEVLQKMKACLEGNEIPKASNDCDYCLYRECAGKAFKKLMGGTAPAPKKSEVKTKSKEKTNEEGKDKLSGTLF